MNNQASYQPSKFRMHNGKLRASRDPSVVSPGSRLGADLVAQAYQLHLERYARGRLVDLGCGMVPLYLLYRSCVDEVVCVDWSNSYCSSPYVDLVHDLNTPLPLRDNEFDTVILADVLEHIIEPVLLLREIGRILRPGGHLILNTPFLYPIHEQPYDYFRYTEFGLRHLVSQAGLTINVLEPIGDVLTGMATILGKTFLLSPRSFGRLTPGLVAFCGWLHRTKWGQRLKNRTAAAFASGYFLVAHKPGDIRHN